MTNFILIDPEEKVFSKLTNEFHEFRNYLSKQEMNQVDLELCTIVLDECTHFIAKSYREDKKLIEKTLQYVENVITKAHKKNEVKITIFEGLYGEYRDILNELKKLFKKETRMLFEDWFDNERKALFG